MAAYVTDQGQLAELVARLRQESAVALDTEFMREKTYFARLCLIQVAAGDVVALVDPLAIEDLSSLRDLLTDPAVTKVFHAGTQDLEILHRALGVATTPVFDTQVAATLAGFPQQVGYAALCADVLGVKLDKGDTYTDWSRRPLSATQIAYAENDVRHLLPVYEHLLGKLEKTERLGWLEDDFRRMADAAYYTVVPEEQFRRIKRVSSLSRRHLAVAREVAAWREREAMQRDLPKRWVMGDESIIEIARRMPASETELRSIRGVADKMGRRSVVGLLEAVKRGAELPDDQLPSLPKKKRFVGDVDGAVDLMVALVRLRAREHGVAMPLLASRDDLERLAAGDREDSVLTQGWRASIVGDELMELLAGDIKLSVSGGELVIDHTKRASNG